MQTATTRHIYRYLISAPLLSGLLLAAGCTDNTIGARNSDPTAELIHSSLL